MLVMYWLKSCVPSGETWSVTCVQPPFLVRYSFTDLVTVWP